VHVCMLACAVQSRRAAGTWTITIDLSFFL
jgi:hypothetical protein